MISAYGKWLAAGSTQAYDWEQEKFVAEMVAVRGTGTLKSSEVCLNHLFVHVDFAAGQAGAGTVGVALLKTICAHGTFLQNRQPHARNVGFVTTLSRQRTMPTWSTVLTARWN